MRERERKRGGGGGWDCEMDRVKAVNRSTDTEGVKVGFSQSKVLLLMKEGGSWRSFTV